MHSMHVCFLLPSTPSLIYTHTTQPLHTLFPGASTIVPISLCLVNSPHPSHLSSTFCSLHLAQYTSPQYPSDLINTVWSPPDCKLHKSRGHLVLYFHVNHQNLIQYMAHIRLSRNTD